MWFWAVYKKDKGVTVSPPFETREMAESFGEKNSSNSKYVVTETKTRRHPVSMSSILRNKVGLD